MIQWLKVTANAFFQMHLQTLATRLVESPSKKISLRRWQAQTHTVVISAIGKTALEYAGFVDSAAQEKQEEQPARPAEDNCSIVKEATSEIKLINLCGKPITFLDRNGESDVLPPAGKAYVCFNDPVQPVAAKVIGTIINDVPVVASRLRKITVLSDGGIEQKFPPPTNNTFYIVSEVVARNVYRFGRSSLDLLYPQSKYMANGVMYIETLGMVYTKNLPICSRQ